MDIGRREFLHSAGAALALATLEVAAVAIPEPPAKPIGWAKWSPDDCWHPVYGWTPPDRRIEPATMPYAVVACYADAA